MKKGVLWLNLVIVLVVVNGLILHKERILADGRTVFLKLVPRDTRSLIQGDYMRLVYDLAQRADQDGAVRGEGEGCLVIRRDDRGVASFLRLYRGGPLDEGELLLRYRYRNGVRLGSESYFIQEGRAESFRKAVFGELKVAPSGESVLAGLRDGDLKPLDGGNT
jgi:uncharacterized membrane-anchored protein